MPKFTHILYATDLGEHNNEVFRRALNLAHQCQAELTVLHAIEPMGQFTHALMEMHVSEDQHQALMDQGIQRLRDQVHAQWEALQQEADMPHAEPQVRIEEGRPADLILELSAQGPYDLVVLGSHGHSTLGEVLLGSTAHSVSQKAKVPVLLVPVGHV